MMRRGEDDEESVFVVADKVFRMQVEWMVQHTGVRRDFPAIMRKIWWSYLTAALPDVADGVEEVLLSEPTWMQWLREIDLAHLFDIPARLITPWLRSLEKTAFPESSTQSDKKRSFKTRHTRMPKKGYQTRTIEVRLRHQRMLALMYLGLQLCGEQTLISDLLRWIRTLQYPYLSPDLPREQFISYNKINELRPISMPVHAEIEWLMAMMCRTLKLQASDFPPLGVAPVVARFVEELNLPRALTGFVMGIAEQVHMSEVQVDVVPGSLNSNWRRSRGVEAFAMACVVYAMRILFGMDGENESKISEATVVLQSLIGEEPQLFDFREWVFHMDYRRLQLFRHTHLLSWTSIRAELFLFDAGSDRLDIPSRRVGYISEEEKKRLIRRLEEEATEQPSPLLVLPPTHRPFRAHTEALAKTYPRLSVDFASYSIQHLAKDASLPKTWKIAKGSREEAREWWAKLRGAQIAGQDTCPYRSQNWVGIPSGHVQPSLLMDEVPSYSMRWLLQVCAEIIEHSPERFLKEVMFLELALFPDNVSSKRPGLASAFIFKMRTG